MKKEERKKKEGKGRKKEGKKTHVQYRILSSYKLIMLHDL